MRLARSAVWSLATSLLLVSAPAQALAQDTLILEEGVLELENLETDADDEPLYGGAYFSPYENLDQRLLAALDQAKPGSTVYMSYYSLSFAEYPKKFKELRDRGVTVRLNLYEKEAVPATKRMDDDLVAEGFDVRLVPNLRHPLGRASLHTKFTVVNDELVATGSANLSASASLANHEHIVVVQGAALARKYIEEFEEQRRAADAMAAAMSEDEWERFYSAWSEPFPADWTSGSPTRAAQLARELRRIDQKTENAHPRVQTYFSPEDALDQRCREHLLTARRSVKVAMYTFVNGLAGTLAQLARQGVEVTVIADDHQQEMDAAAWANERLEGEPNLHYVRATNHLGLYSSIHHKYAVIDDEVVLAGSYNWTGSATRYNDENLIVIRSKRLAARFAEDFASMLQEYAPDSPSSAADFEAQGTETSVLFAVTLPFSVPRDQDVHVVLSTPAGQRTVALRNSRSTGENWLGSVTLPRGQEVSWKVAVGDRGGVVGALEGDPGQTRYEDGAPRPLLVAKNGLAQIVHETWRGPSPFAE